MFKKQQIISKCPANQWKNECSIIEELREAQNKLKNIREENLLFIIKKHFPNSQQRLYLSSEQYDMERAMRNFIFVASQYPKGKKFSYSDFFADIEKYIYQQEETTGLEKQIEEKRKILGI